MGQEQRAARVAGWLGYLPTHKSVTLQLDL